MSNNKQLNHKTWPKHKIITLWATPNNYITKPCQNTNQPELCEQQLTSQNQVKAKKKHHTLCEEQQTSISQNTKLPHTLRATLTTISTKPGQNTKLSNVVSNNKHHKTRSKDKTSTHLVSNNNQLNHKIRSKQKTIEHFVINNNYEHNQRKHKAVIYFVSNSK